MDPVMVSDKLYVYGYWCTYWQLRNTGHTRLGALWLIWVARCYTLHRYCQEG